MCKVCYGSDALRPPGTRNRGRDLSQPPSGARRDQLTNAATLPFGSAELQSTPSQFYLFPHIAAYTPGRVHRAVRSEKPVSCSQSGITAWPRSIWETLGYTHCRLNQPTESNGEDYA